MVPYLNMDAKHGQFQNSYEEIGGLRNVVSTYNANNVMDCKEIK